jgi:hypothetical protein
LKRATPSSSVDEGKKNETKSDKCDLCGRSVQGEPVEWNKYGGLVICSHHQPDLSMIEMFLEPSVLEPDASTLRKAFTAWRRHEDQGRSTRYLASKLETSRPNGKSRTTKVAKDNWKEDEDDRREDGEERERDDDMAEKPQRRSGKPETEYDKMEDERDGMYG